MVLMSVQLVSHLNALAYKRLGATVELLSFKSKNKLKTCFVSSFAACQHRRPSKAKFENNLVIFFAKLGRKIFARRLRLTSCGCDNCCGR